MKVSTYLKRSAQADQLAKQLQKLIEGRAITKYGCQDSNSVAHFSMGYLNSMVARLAAQSPASLRELESAVNYLEKQ